MKDSLIKITLVADANTPIQIVSGDSIYNITNTSTAPKEYKAGADTMTIYGDVKQLTCSSNKTNITKINVSSNNTLTFLACTDNNLDTLDVSNCSALTYLSCSYNNLTSLILNNSITNVSCHHNNLDAIDVSNCSKLSLLSCENNNLSFLDVSNNTELLSLNCCYNNLTSLDVRNNTSLGYLYCYGIPFTTVAYDKLMCSMPMKDTIDNARFYPLEDANDTNAIRFMEANSLNAKAKNWKVNYILANEIPMTNGNYDCSGVNMLNYITLNVTKDESIAFDIYTGTNDIPVKIVSGDWDTTIVTGTDWTETMNFYAHADSIVIYGDVIGFDCNGNNLNIIGLDASHNELLEVLYCDSNDLTFLDVSGCTKLEDLSCYENSLTTLDLSNNPNLVTLICFNNELTSLNLNGCVALEEVGCWTNHLTTLDVSNCPELYVLMAFDNELSSLDISNNKNLYLLAVALNPFTTAGFDSLMCSLPMRDTADGAAFISIYDASDANYNVFMATNAKNATAKNWEVVDLSGEEIPATTGDYDCNGGGGEDPTNISEIKLSNIELYPNPAKTMLTIENATENVQIFDISGRLLINVENKETNLLQINVANLANDLYFVKIGNYTTKFVKE